MSDKATLQRLLYEHRQLSVSSDRYKEPEDRITVLFDAVRDELHTRLTAAEQRAEQAEARVRELLLLCEVNRNFRDRLVSEHEDIFSHADLLEMLQEEHRKLAPLPNEGGPQ